MCTAGHCFTRLDAFLSELTHFSQLPFAQQVENIKGTIGDFSCHHTTTTYYYLPLGIYTLCIDASLSHGALRIRFFVTSHIRATTYLLQRA